MMLASWRYKTFRMSNPEDFIESFNSPVKSNLEVIGICATGDGAFLVVVRNSNPIPAELLPPSET